MQDAFARPRDGLLLGGIFLNRTVIVFFQEVCFWSLLLPLGPHSRTHTPSFVILFVRRRNRMKGKYSRAKQQ